MRILALALTLAASQADARGRDLGIPFEGTPGPLNAITDVTGVEVGQVTLISGRGMQKAGQGPVRTGVTVILPRGKGNTRPVNGGYFNLNGNGEMTGRSYLEDFGIVYGPIGISDTNAVGQVYAGIQQWNVKRFKTSTWPVVAETWSGYLSDLDGFHVKSETAMEALDRAKSGAVEEGNVGGGTGMVCFGFKGGIGTASRVFDDGGKPYTVGVLVQCNTGFRDTLRIAGAPVGEAMKSRWLPCFDRSLSTKSGDLPPCTPGSTHGKAPPDQGSIIIVVATDAPLMPKQLDRVAKRAALGLGRLGSFAGNTSGDLIVSFSTGLDAGDENGGGAKRPIAPFSDDQLDPVFRATTEATEEAIVNALVAAKTMTGVDGTRYFGLPHDELQTILRRYNRLVETKR